MLYDYILQEQSDSLLLLLQCLEGEAWATQLLAGTYIDEGQYELASSELQKLDSSSVENAEFIALCTALMDSTLSSSEGGRVATALAQTQQIANNANSHHKTLAEAVLSIYRNSDYVRHGEPISWKDNNNVLDSPSGFSIVPNPSMGDMTILLNKTTTIAQNLYVYDMSGRLVQTLIVPANTEQISVRLQHLPSGMYYCRLDSTNTSNKLVIIR